ncbi:hypothetical protein [Streptomyces canus]|uniref:hypothetical protein n=1 Tax=Streptomyces canus TaxID=58343 RepID=UPI0033B7AEA1
MDNPSPSEIADLPAIKIVGVENARFRPSSQVRRLGELYVPPSIEAEWARALALAKANTRKKAA